MLQRYPVARMGDHVAYCVAPAWRGGGACAFRRNLGGGGAKTHLTTDTTAFVVFRQRPPLLHALHCSKFSSPWTGTLPQLQVNPSGHRLATLTFPKGLSQWIWDCRTMRLTDSANVRHWPHRQRLLDRVLLKSFDPQRVTRDLLCPKDSALQHEASSVPATSTRLS